MTARPNLVLASALICLTFSTAASAATRLVCGGSEPFWDLSVSEDSKAKVRLPGEGPTGIEERSYGPLAEVGAAGYITGTAMEITGWRNKTVKGAKVSEKLTISAFKTGDSGCLYTESDDILPYEVLVKTGKDLLLGCCRLADAPPPPPPAPVDASKILADVAKIKQVLPAGLELAGAYHRVDGIEIFKDDEYPRAVERSYVLADLNKDGATDLAVVTEGAPAEDDFGERELRIYLADATGQLVLFRQSKNVVMIASDGGLFGDPYNGMSVNARGTLTISHYGGSADRWGFTQKFQFRADDFYLIGTMNDSYDTRTGAGVTSDTNLLTGDREVTTTRPRPGRPDSTPVTTVTRKKVAKAALKKLTDTTVGF